MNPTLRCKKRLCNRKKEPVLENSTKEQQYGLLFEVQAKHGRSSFGFMANESWNCDPKRTLFTLARYKFVAKMLEGKQSVLEIGCGDAFGTRIVQQHVCSMTAIDFDPIFIEDIKSRANPHWPLQVLVHDAILEPITGIFDAIYCLDVLEHISPDNEIHFMKHVVQALPSNGVFIAGMPSLESQVYASPQSKAGHVNCKSGHQFKQDMLQWFDNVFLFSMNDEVVHTGFAKMAHYLIAVGVGLKIQR